MDGLEVARSTSEGSAAVRWLARLVWLAVLSCGGCGSWRAPEFRLNMEGRDPRSVSIAQRTAIREALRDLFGTPDEPRVPEGVPLDVEKLRMAAGPVASDQRGRQQGLYRQHCGACHGVSGDGAGPAAILLNPYPRDFRNGVFKYTSTRSGMKPVREDLRRTLLRGLPGTAMPSFARLPEEEIEALIEYAQYLSIRGETERYLFQLVVDEGEPLPLGVDAIELVLEQGAMAAASLWGLPAQDPAQWVVRPPPPIDSPDQLALSIQRGRELYASKDAECVKCHGPQGAGDGEQQDLYDDWNEAKRGVDAQQTARRARLFTLPLQRLKARDFSEGIFRGGDRPEDLYLRIHVGIKGTPMPAAGPAPGAPGAYTEEEIWHVVHYILSLSGRLSPPAVQRQ
ncbi:MAG TPA: c-type cytochrome [Planctomycetaceae bacterium]|nr:c-type cytochrome [Planctomycetaceae bacterium]